MILQLCYPYLHFTKCFFPICIYFYFYFFFRYFPHLSEFSLSSGLQSVWIADVAGCICDKKYALQGQALAGTAPWLGEFCTTKPH